MISQSILIQFIIENAARREIYGKVVHLPVCILLKLYLFSVFEFPACSELLMCVCVLTDQAAEEAPEEGSRDGGSPQRWLHRAEGRLGPRTLRETDSRRKGLRPGRDD